MSRETRYVTEMVEHHKTVQTMSCDGLCGTIQDVPPLGRPEGWISVFRTVDGHPKSWDFCDFTCFIGWATDQEENFGDYLDDWTASIKNLERSHEEQVMAVINQGEQEREE